MASISQRYSIDEVPQEVFAVRFSADGHSLAACARDNTIKLWDARMAGSSGAWQLLQHYAAHSAAVTSLSFHP